MKIFLLFVSIFVATSGSINSPDIGCFVEGECAMWIDRHNLVGIVEGILTPKDCLLNCKNTEECLFFTHFLLKEECYLYSSCEYFFYECENDDCISGESSCEAIIA